jgi:hypothetical protein
MPGGKMAIKARAAAQPSIFLPGIFLLTARSFRFR